MSATPPESNHHRARKGRILDRKIRMRSHTVIAHGLPLRVWQDLYHRALTISWPVFFISLALLFLVLNSVFASLYELGGAAIANQNPKGFAGAFFFSVETLATVGYGDMHPRTLYGHLVATLEIFIGMSGIALATGLIFARFSRPRAKIVFSQYAVVRPIDGRTTLMVRTANARQNVIVEARARLRLMRVERSSEGYVLRKIYDLRLVRDQQPMFYLGWNLMHVIDEASPLFGQTPESLAEQDASLLITIEGSDENTAQTMQARYSWLSDDIRWQHRFVDLIREVNGVSHIDYTHFDDVEPLQPHELQQAPTG
ncbi:ion channel [Paraburkholderia hospita]|jgi:inward rectifier potassium channel|uniref:Inward rectifier potassium channel n=1 Tax=Paraburkholderia hospita TaxID=169430 RepID=A0AAJ4SR35_9BURK|nr:ion channel [Paraburkholderia hospita]AUT67073.1 Inward rectifier potassium channel [Paraburkholderia hospita]AXE97166.1 Inward rectifier potassium channel [Paraburkholderia hospita]SEH41475.1 inward rectifier potassium channel [Paraburkholderia hospita]SKC48779.1 Inward rectifier potassium channel [Paraburkholderia hospita]